MGVSEIKTSSVPLLITKHQWLDWHSKITLELRKAGYGQLLRQKRNVVRTTTSTNADADTPDISQTANGSAVVTWIAIQDRAVATVLDCLGGDLQTKFEGETKVQELLDNLKKHLQPHSNAIVNDAVSRLATLTYKTDAQDLSHEFEDIMRQFEQSWELLRHGDTADVTVKWCTRCNKPFHDLKECYGAHPELREKREEERRKRRRANTRGDSSGGVFMPPS
ncbi:hypothetical protein N7535_008499 [Penicillium sp. DV-2018c]|nr:hypothetical protein N7535_008499 [Penicillium sp. DV-2018c]